MLATSAPGFVEIEINALQFIIQTFDYSSKTSSVKTQLT